MKYEIWILSEFCISLARENMREVERNKHKILNSPISYFSLVLSGSLFNPIFKTLHIKMFLYTQNDLINIIPQQG
jgi:hypothetical protein